MSKKSVIHENLNVKYHLFAILQKYYHREKNPHMVLPIP